MGTEQNAAPKVSIIVPVYNMERYLGKCLDALTKQTLCDIEIVAVNDGSTDSSLSILRVYAEKDPRIRIIDKPNSGYGASMNRGIDEARGEYIGIVEPDDYPDLVMFDKLYNAAKKHDCDLVKCNYYRTYEDHEEPEWNLHGYGYGAPFDPVEKPRVICTVPSIWAALYSRSMLVGEGVRFRETPGAAFQDTGFTLKAWFAAKRCVLLRRPLLHYRMDNPGSSSKTTDKVYTVCEELDSAEQFMRERPMRAGAFAPWFHVGKWGKYRWNYDRIAPELHGEFAQRMYNEFAAARDAGELDLSLFADISRCQVAYLLDAGPKAFVERYPDGYPDDWQEDAHVADTVTANGAAVPKGPSPAVTVMVACYNCESFITECLDSLKAQTYGDFEVIVVDDCSTDGSVEAVRMAIAADDRFTLVQLDENKGPGAARNAAIERSHGEYIMYVDADDRLAVDALEKLISRARRQNLDELYFGAQSFFEDAAAMAVMYEDFGGRASFDGVVTGKELFTFFSDRGQYFTQGALRMVRRELLMKWGIRFPEAIIHEDVMYGFKILVHSERSSFLNEPLYLRRQRAGSIMGSKRRSLENVQGHLASIGFVRSWVHAHADELDGAFLQAAGREVGLWKQLVARDWATDLTDDEKAEFMRGMAPDEHVDFEFGILGMGQAAERAAAEWRESQTYRLGDIIASGPRKVKLQAKALLSRRKVDRM